jgi:hypothetical protein
MKLVVLFFLITFSVHAQRDKTFPRTAQKPYEKVTEAGSITFTKTMNSLQFDRYTDNEVKQKVTRFMKTNRRGYTALGSYTLRLVKRNGQLYILEKDRPDKLILLE